MFTELDVPISDVSREYELAASAETAYESPTIAVVEEDGYNLDITCVSRH